MANGDGFTPIERKMMDILKDGNRHLWPELHACLNDELQPLENIQMHISNIRKKIRGKGQEIVCEFAERRKHYRLVRLINVND